MFQEIRKLFCFYYYNFDVIHSCLLIVNSLSRLEEIRLMLLLGKLGLNPRAPSLLEYNPNIHRKGILKSS